MFTVDVKQQYNNNNNKGMVIGTTPTLTKLAHFILETPKGVLAKSGDPDQMPHNVASDLGLHYFASCSAIFQQKYVN